MIHVRTYGIRIDRVDKKKAAGNMGGDRQRMHARQPKFRRCFLLMKEISDAAMSIGGVV
jgi:hypothetical protein